MRMFFSKAVSIIMALVLVIGTNCSIVHAAETSTAPLSQDITVVNNAGKADKVTVGGVSSGDVVRVYNAAANGKLLKSITVYSSQVEANLSISQLGKTAGSIYVSVITKGMLESSRTKVDYEAEPVSEDIISSNVLIVNNAGKSDTVTVTGLIAGDTVKVYNAVTGGRLMGTAKVSSSKTEVTVSIYQVGSAEGSVYISVISSGMLESNRVKVEFTAEPKSDSLNVASISITNNAGKSDTVEVSGVNSGDVIKVYNAATGGRLIGSAAVSTSKTEVTVTVSQLGSSGGSVFASVTGKGMLESDRVEVPFAAEAKSDNPFTDNITVANNVGKSDTVTVTNLTAGDAVKVYNAASGGKLLGFGAVASSKTEVTVTVSQLGNNAGSVYVSITSKNMLESDRVKVDFAAKPKSYSPNSTDISVENNGGISDTVYVTNLTSGDVVKVYNAVTGGKLLGSATVANSKTEAVVSIKQLGTGAGVIFVSVTSAGELESDRISAAYSAEVVTTPVGTDDIVITNNAGKADTIEVVRLSESDVVKIYSAATGGKMLKSATVAAAEDDITLSIAQLGTGAGSVYVSVTSPGEQESTRTKADFIAEPRSDTLDAQNITITNNAGSPDTIEVTGLTDSDTIKIYSTSTGAKLWGSATVATSKTELVISVPQLGTAAGSVYVSVVSQGKQESARTKADFSAEPKSNKVYGSNVTITNNAGASDTIHISGLSEDDTVKAYTAEAGGSLLGSVTVAASAKEATITIKQLGSNSGSVYVAIKVTGKLESDRVKVDYPAETKSNTVDISKIIVYNNAGAADSLQIEGLLSGDTVKVYSSAVGGSLLGSATVTAYGKDATVSINQLGSDAGNMYVSVMSTNKLESDRVEVSYPAEQKSDNPAVSNISVANNAGIASSVTVKGLLGNDIVKVYDSAVGGNLLGSATVAAYNDEVTISVAQLSSVAGSVYVTITSKNKFESSRTKADFAAKPISDTVSSTNTTVTNNAGIQDTIEVTGIEVGDIIKIYNAESGGSLIGSATVPSGSMQATVTITQLGAFSGSVYVTLTRIGKTESRRVKIDFPAEGQSSAPAEGNITIVNNSGKADTITVSGLVGSDIVKVYNTSSGGTLLCSGTVIAYNSEVTISVTQLGSAAGTLYITVTSTGKTESNRTKAEFTAESASPATGNIMIINNAGTADTITVTGLTTNDLLKVYDFATGGNLLGSATVAANSNEATVTVTQLTTGSGSVYVTVTSFGRSESSRTKADYASEASTSAPFIGYIDISNNAGISDTVTVMNLKAGDVIRVYDSLTGGTLLGYATVQSSKTEATVSITQLGEGGGSVYISVTSVGKTESTRTKADYVSELSSEAPYIGNITVVNNSGKFDTVTVTGLKTGDTIKVYDAVDGGNLLGTISVAYSKTEATVSISQIGTSAGSIYISITSTGKTESQRTKVDFIAE